MGAEKDRLAREVRSGPPLVPTTLTPDNLTQRVRALLDNLGTALAGDERDAARARDILRSLITEVKVTPYDADGRRPDGRGVGAVRVQIEGEVSRLVDHAMLDRKIMHERGAEDVHDLPIATFCFWVELDRTLSPEQEGLWRDAAIVGRMLDDADWPTTFQEMIAALNDRGRETNKLENDIDETRARIALAQFKRDGWVRSVRLDGAKRGWVWDDRDVTDNQWRVRYYQRPKVLPTARDGGQASGPTGVIRLSGPEPDVMIIGPRESK